MQPFNTKSNEKIVNDSTKQIDAVLNTLSVKMMTQFVEASFTAIKASELENRLVKIRAVTDRIKEKYTIESNN